MQTYIVRVTHGQKGAGEIVGIFAAHSLDQLFWLVDECCSPLECECRVLGPGGIYWDQLTGVSVPRPEFDEDGLRQDWVLLPPEPTATDDWDDILTGRKGDDGWQPLHWPEEELGALQEAAAR